MSSGSFKQQLLDRSYQYSLKLLQTIDSLNSLTISNQVIIKQVLRSGTSVGANIAEAQAASSKKDFINFLTYALKSANETNYWLKLLKDTKKINPYQAKELIDESIELAKILGRSITTLKNN